MPAATVLATELARLRASAETERRLGRDLVEDLLTHGDEEHTRTAAQALGYDLERLHRVLVVTRGGMRSRDALLFDAVRRAVRDLDLGTMLVARGETVVVLADRDGDWEELHNSVGAEHDGTPCRIGVGGVCTAIGDFRRSHREAELAVRLQDAVGGPERAIVFESLGVFRLLATVDDPALLQEFVDEWIGVLIDYDARRGTQLVDTLSGYLERGGNYDATAALVGAHRNTLKYRLRRIREISGLDLGDADTLFNLQLATRAWNTLRALRSEEP
jgi:sugar diacid utilization regulator